MAFSITILPKEEEDAPSAPTKLTFDGTQRVVIGRGPGCDVRIPDVTVSHRHASMRSDAGRIVVVDEGSCNGTYVDGNRLDPRTAYGVKVGSSFQVGGVTVLIGEAEGPATRDVAMATRELAMQMVMAALAKSGADAAPLVRVVDGPDVGRELRLTELDLPYRVGRDERAELPLSDADVSRVSVELLRMHTGVIVRNHGGKNPVFIGETAVREGQELPWRASVPLRLGRTWLTLEEPILDALREIESAEDQSFAPASMPPARMEENRDSSPPPEERAVPAPPAVPLKTGTSKRPSAAAKKPSRGGGLERALAGFAVVVLVVSIVLTVWIIRG